MNLLNLFACLRYNVSNYFYYDKQNGGLFADDMRDLVRAIRSDEAIVKGSKWYEIWKFGGWLVRHNRITLQRHLGITQLFQRVLNHERNDSH